MTQSDFMSPSQIQKLVENFADIVASNLFERIKPELQHIVEEASTNHDLAKHQTRNAPNRSLWSVSELAEDSGIAKGTWYKWVNQRKIPFVRLGRAVRVRDSDYRKFIQKSFCPEIGL